MHTLRPPHPPLALTLSLLALLLLGGLFRMNLGRAPTGDEPHYLVMAHSLVYDHDLDVANNYGHGPRAMPIKGELLPHVSPFNPRRSGHYPALALLIAPAYALGGPTGVLLFFVLAHWLAFMMLGGILVRLGLPRPWAWGLTLLFLASVPWGTMAAQIYPDSMGLPLVAGVLWLATQDGGARVLRGITAGILLGVVAALHIKFLPLAGIMALGAIWLMGRRWSFSGPMILAAALVYGANLALLYRLYGLWQPWAPYGTLGAQGGGGNLALGLAAYLFDFQYGLIPQAPGWLAFAAGASLALRLPAGRERRMLTLCALGALVQLCAVGSTPIQLFGWSTAARNLTIAVPLALPVAAFAIERLWRQPWARRAWQVLLGFQLLWFIQLLRFAWARYDARTLIARMVSTSRERIPFFYDYFQPGRPPATGAWIAAALLTLLGAALALTAWRVGRRDLPGKGESEAKPRGESIPRQLLKLPPAEIFVFASLGLVVLGSLAGLFRYTWWVSQDGVGALLRTIAFRSEWDHGYLWIRWASRFARGYGSPVFVFEAPGLEYLCAMIGMAGFTPLAALKLGLALARVGGVLALATLARRRFGAYGGWCAGIAFTVAPCQPRLLFLKGALAGSCALNLVPWVLLLADRMTSERGVRHAVWGALALGLVMFTDPAAGLLTALLTAAWVLAQAAPGQRLMAMQRAGLMISGAIGLTAFYWLPEMALSKAIQGGTGTAWREWLVASWRAIPRVATPALCAALGGLGAFLPKPSPRHGPLLATATLLALILALQAKPRRKLKLEIGGRHHPVTAERLAGMLREGYPGEEKDNTYLPVGAAGAARVRRAAPKKPVLAPAAAGFLLRQGFWMETYRAELHGPAVATWPYHWFPGWRVTIDGKETATRAGENGLVQFSSPAGTHLITPYFGRTGYDWIGQGLSAATLLLLWRKRREKKPA